MTQAASAASRRFDVVSRDGTSIGVWVEGEGPALVLVHGSLADHTTFEQLIGVLRRSFTTYAMDRRGFGSSGDTPPYAVAREFEDVAAVVDGVSARTGGPVALWGHSYGASCAMGAAALTRNAHHVVLYEPSFGLVYPAGSVDRIERALAAGDRETAIVEVLTGALGMSPEDVEGLKTAPLWPTRLAVAHTIPRECRVEEGWVYEPGQFDGADAPTLLLSGTESGAELLAATHAAAAALPNARVHTLVGHGHMAHKVVPEMVKAIIEEFVQA